jgi:HlyD family secretion protein
MINKQQQSVKVDAMMSEPLPGWFSGLALEANIIIREKENALVIPKTKLLPGDSVWVESKDGRRKVKVETGIETLDEIEILSGIDTSDQLIGAR